jgi:rod shape-determining protein MreD
MAVHALYLLLGVLSLLIQGVLLHLGLPEYLVPQLVVLLVVFLAFYEASVAGSFLAFVLGLLLDLSSAEALGPWAGACVTVFGIFALLSQRLFIDSPLVAMVVSALAVMSVECLFLMIGVNSPEFSWFLARSVFWHSVVSALCAPVLFSLLGRRVRKMVSHSVGRSSVMSTV